MPDDDRWLVIGLGNPGADHAGTRHNVGAEAARALAGRHGVELSGNKRVRCDVGQVRLAEARLVVAVPHTQMNVSGGPVQQAGRWFKVPVERTIVLHDDLDLDLGQLRVKRGGGHGGHNGLRDLDRALASRDYLRVRIGIGRPPGRMSARDHVLGRFPPADRDVVDDLLQRAGDAVESLIAEGLEPAQNRFHGAPG